MDREGDRIGQKEKLSCDPAPGNWLSGHPIDSPVLRMAVQNCSKLDQVDQHFIQLIDQALNVGCLWKEAQPWALLQFGGCPGSIATSWEKRSFIPKGRSGQHIRKIYCTLVYLNTPSSVFLWCPVLLYHSIYHTLFKLLWILHWIELCPTNVTTI